LLWLYPLVRLVASGASTVQDVSSALRVPSKTAKSLLHYATKFKLIEKDEKGYKVTDNGSKLLDSFELLKEEGRRLAVKGEDGCFLIIVRRKKGVKVVRVPCSEVSLLGSPREGEPQSRRA